MRTKREGLSCAVALLFCVAAAGADEWDVGSSTDDSPATTNNELIHGTDQAHDLAAHGVADQDWYVIGSKQQSSWIVVLDGTTADLGWNIEFSRYDQAGTALQQTWYSSTGPLAYSKYLAWENTTATEAIHTVVVRGAACGTGCDAMDRYRIRAYDTTIAIPRYNNTGGQITVLICQHTAFHPLTWGHAYLWNASGTLVTTIPMTFGFRETKVVNLATANGGVANNTGGAVTVSHTGDLGGMACKSVALEPATGFSFDSPGVTRQK